MYIYNAIEMCMGYEIMMVTNNHIPMHIPNVPEECDLPVMGRYMVETSELGLKCNGWLLARNNFGQFGKHI